jgi:hypothetical protein
VHTRTLICPGAYCSTFIPTGTAICICSKPVCKIICGQLHATSAATGKTEWAHSCSLNVVTSRKVQRVRFLALKSLIWQQYRSKLMFAPSEGQTRPVHCPAGYSSSPWHLAVDLGLVCVRDDHCCYAMLWNCCRDTATQLPSCEVDIFFL